jgi:AraC-like DNA-binding protein
MEDISLASLAEKFHFSKYHVSHLFKDYVGISPYDYLIIRRLYICNDLIRGKHTVKEACFLVGFCNYSNFYRLYKKHFKITPQQFKEQLKT